MKLTAVHVPGNGIPPPVVAGAVDDNLPGVKVVVRDGDLVCPAGPRVRIAVPLAVGGAVAPHIAVDLLHDVELAAGRPARATWLSDRVSQQPESRPDAFLGRSRVLSKADGGLDDGALACLRSEGVPRLKPARGPTHASCILSPGNNLERVSTAELDVASAAAKVLPLVVGYIVVVANVPGASAR